MYMGKQPIISDEHLLNYLDGVLSLPEKEQLEQILTTDSIVVARLEKLRSIHNQLAVVRIEEPSRNFTRKVMEQLNYPLASGFSVRNSILLLAGVLVAVGIATILLAAGVFDATTSIDLNQIVVSNKYISKELPSISLNGKFIVNLIILANIALAFLVLDRAVLKPWFERRRNMHFT
jgi:hypothetical protein